MKTRIEYLIFASFALLTITFFSCRQNKETNKPNTGKDTAAFNDTLHMTGDSTDIYGKGYFKYQDTIDNWHMGFSIPRDSIYKVENLKEFERLNLLIRTNPATPGPYLDRGNHFQNINKYREAIDDYNRYIAIVPDNQSAYQNRGTAHQRLKNYDSALWDYSKVIELKPRDTIAFFNRGGVYETIDNPWQAIREYDSVIIIDPRLAKGYYNRGGAYVTIKNYEKAIKDFEKAIDLNPKYKEELMPKIAAMKRKL